MEERVMQDEDFPVADAIARALYERRTDVNELVKCVGFLRDLARDELEGELFFKYLDTVASEDQAAVRSGRTLDYYHAIRDACHQHLMSYKEDPQAMAQILGWAVRLMRYHKVAPKLKPPTPPEAISAPPPSEFLAQPRRIEDLRAGMTLRGTVRRIQPYGAFVDIGVGRDGLVHISELSDGYVNRVEDVVAEGDSVIVWVKDVDRARKRIGLSMKRRPTGGAARSKRGR